MREVAFIKQNKQKWLDFEQALFGKIKKSPNELAQGYIHLMNDLSYAQTYYPKSKSTVYLNYLAAQIFQKIYKTKRTDRNQLVQFFAIDIPLVLHEYRIYIGYAFILFFLFTAIGAVSAHYDLDFIRLILGDAYVNETLQNIKNGNPVAIYKTGSNWGMSIGITLNNIYVALRCFIWGIFLGFGTFIVLLQNCIMLGAFQYMFYREGVLLESMRGIWIHGAMEIFAIVISAASGFALGASVLFPKTFSRLNSFKIGFRNSLKICLSTMPFFLMAGILEGYVTRYALEMPLVLNLIIIFGTLSFISFYYLIYPYWIYKKSKAYQL